MNTKGRRVFAAAMLLALLAGCDDQLYTDLSEREVNTMVALLRMQDIDARRHFDDERQTYSLSAPSSQFAEAIMLLEQNNLPNARFSSLGDMFKAEGLVTSPFEERARFVHAMNQELAHSISAIDGVTSARVHLVIPEDNPLDPGSERARASVFIYHTPEFRFAADVPKIKIAVANSVDKLAYENVSILTFSTQKGQDGL